MRAVLIAAVAAFAFAASPLPSQGAAHLTVRKARVNFQDYGTSDQVSPTHGSRRSPCGAGHKPCHYARTVRDPTRR